MRTIGCMISWIHTRSAIQFKDSCLHESKNLLLGARMNVSCLCVKIKNTLDITTPTPAF